ncbi:MAG: hypothetical protein NE334_11895 [Lentisphaeraceae bacterium]|nr:hypothetical protein [Lentisphaeraceae bacterium]
MEKAISENRAALTKIKERFVNNSKGFFEKYRFLIMLLVITALLDAFSTFCFMYVIGPKYELHPVVRELSYLLGPLVGPFLGGFLKISLGICAIIYLRRFEKQLLGLACLLYSYAFMHNLRVTGIFNLL